MKSHRFQCIKDNYVYEFHNKTFFKPPVKFTSLKGGFYKPNFDNGEFYLTPYFLEGTTANELSTALIADEFEVSDRNLFREKFEQDFNEAIKHHDHNEIVKNYFHLEIYNKGLMRANNRISSFIQSSRKKLSLLFVGETGGGKSKFIDHKSVELVEKYDAIVLRIESFEDVLSLKKGVQIINKYLKNRLKVIVIEELAELIYAARDKATFLHLLDTNFMRTNVLYLITTNFPDKIPKNISDRPSRVDDIIEVIKEENDSAYIPEYYKFLTGKEFPVNELTSGWLEKAIKELTPAYFEELFALAENEEFTLQESWEYLKKRRSKIKNDFADDVVGFQSAYNGPPF